MKKILFLLFILFVVYSGCDNINGGGSNPIDPSTGEVLMVSIGYDSVYSFFGSGTIVSTKSLSPAQMNFSDRNYMRIRFSYKGSSISKDSLFTISYTNSFGKDVKVYSLVDNSPLSTFRTVDLTIPSPMVNTNFYYTVKANGNYSKPPYFVIKNLNIYKKN